MGQFTNTLFQVLLGWVQNIVSALWQLIVSPDGSGGLRWLLDHWLALVILLCVAGGLIDFVVYLIRWQPYRVWRSFFSGGHCSARHEGKEESACQRHWAYADGTTSLEEPTPPRPMPDEKQLELPVRPVRRVARYSGEEHAYYQPVYPQTWKHAAKDSEGEDE